MPTHAADFHYVSGSLECFFDIAVFEDTLPNAVRSGFFVQKGIALERILGGHDGRQNFVLCFDEFGGVFGSETRVRDHDGDGLALKHNFVHGHRIILNFLAGAGTDLDEWLHESRDFLAR